MPSDELTAEIRARVELVRTQGGAGPWQRLAWLSAQLLNAPAAIITLITDDKPELAATWRLQGSSGPCVEPAKIVKALCPEDGATPSALLSTTTTYILEDASANADARGTDVLRALGAASGIAVPIKTQVGSAVGTLCILDTKARRWNLREGVLLEELAELVATNLDLQNALESSRYVSPTLSPPAQPAAVAGSEGAHDTVTGLPTRLLLYDRLRQILALARRYDEVLAVLYLRLDGLDTISEAHGERAADLVLAQAATNLATAVRESDTVARLGAHEFMVVLPRVGSLENAAAVAAKMLRAFENPTDIDGHELHLHATIGIAVYPDDGQEAASLLHMAEAAVYRAKALGERIFPVSLSQVGAPRTS